MISSLMRCLRLSELCAFPSRSITVTGCTLTSGMILRHTHDLWLELHSGLLSRLAVQTDLCNTAHTLPLLVGSTHYSEMRVCVYDG